MSRSYFIGFVSSLLLTLVAFGGVYMHNASGHLIFSHAFLQKTIILLALAQLLVQSVFFLHVGSSRKPHDYTIVFIFTLFITAFVLIGSIWIMKNLNYNMMPQHSETEIIQSEAMEMPM